MNKVKIGLLLGLMAGVATVPIEAQVNAWTVCNITCWATD